MVTGDLVLTHGEVAPVTDRLSDSGIEITALHNHLLRAEPPPIYLHVHATGDAVAIATALRTAVEASATPLAESGESGGTALGIDTGVIDRILGHQGKATGAVYKVSIPRTGDHDGRHRTAGPTGTAVAINFQAADGTAATTATSCSPLRK